MYGTIEEFLSDWKSESGMTAKLMEALTDASLGQRVTENGRTLGRLAWHITLTISEMLGHTGLPAEGPAEDAPVPASAAEILEVYRGSANAAAQAIRTHWTNAMLAEEIPMYGQSWTRAFVLAALVKHQIHHRGQMTVLMRQAGLVISGMYGPAREEWAAMGMDPQD